MSDPKQRLTYEQVAAESGMDDWRYLYDKLQARFATGSFAAGVALVDRIGAAADAADHHPDVRLSYPEVDVVLWSHDVRGVTSRDLELARTISGYAAEAGLASRPGEPASIEIALDVPSYEEVQPFWAAVLGYEPSPHEALDPHGVNPALWFQEAPEATGEVPQRFHLDIRVARDVAERRVRDAVAAGGRLVSDERAPAFWVLADAHGNQVCVCTADGRTRS